MLTNSIIWDLVLVLLGAVLGFLPGLVPDWVKKYRQKQHLKRSTQRRAFLDNSKRIQDWLISYYQHKGSDGDLFECRIGGYTVTIPFLTKPEWQQTASLPFEVDTLLSYSDAPHSDFPVDHDLIKSRTDLGQVLFDGPTMFLDRIEQQPNDRIILHVGGCGYFQASSSFMHMEEETFQAVQKDTFNHIPLREAYIPSADQVQKLAKKPFAIGCAVALALKSGDSYELLIHTRSHTTATFGGAKGVTPNFGLEPVHGGAHIQTPILDGFKSSSLIYYNFIKEYLEELYNYEDLIGKVSTRKANPYWFYDLAEAHTILRLIKDGVFALEFLGFGFDAMNGNAIIGLLGCIDDHDCASEIKNSLELNWEIAEKDGELDFEFVDIHSPSLEIWLRDLRYHTGAAFTIAKALERLGQTKS